MDRSENWQLLGGAQAQTLKSGRHKLTRTEVLASQRGRIMRAALDELGELGAAGVTVGGLVERAKVSKKTFYENFDGIEECLSESVATVNLIVGTDMAEAAEVADRSVPFAKVRSMVHELALLAAEEPVIGSAILGSGFGFSTDSAGVWNYYNTARQRILVSYYEDERERTPDLPAATELSAVAAVGLIEHWLMRGLTSGTQESLPAQADEVTAAVVSALSGGQL